MTEARTGTTTALSAVDISQRWFDLQRRIHRLADEAMCEAGLSLARTKVLGVLAEQGPTRQVHVATCLGFAARSVTDTLDALEREGLAARHPDPSDRRAHLVEITDAGRKALDHALTVKRGVMESIFGGLDDGEREQFAAYLDGIRDRIDSVQKVAHVS